MTKNTLYRSIFVISSLIVLSGCTNVEPYERGHLALPHMALETNPQHAAVLEHIAFSRDAISGGYGLSGGGCGCN